MWRPLAVAGIVLAAGCNHATFDQEIVGVWESAGTPSSSALPESLRKSPDWGAQISFADDGTFKWQIDNEEGTGDEYAGVYKVVGYSLDLEITQADGKQVPPTERLAYTVRQQSTGAIQLPLPQDWTGPTVDYFKKG
jgi:hypothetical protein